MLRRPGPLLAAMALGPLLAAVAPVQAGALKWAKRLGACEPPNVFYSARHAPGAKPCCPTASGTCAGGVACPANGVCPGASAIACNPAPPPPRPNVVLMLSDDQAACQYGTAPECRSAATGTPIPPPVTPSLDLLSGYGTVFTIAHNTSAWCFPSINSLLTARYQRNFDRQQRIAEKFPTVATTMRSLGGVSGAASDPYNPGNVVDGYCSFLGGKFSASVGDHGFDAIAKGRKLGRTTCAPRPGGGPPLCGSAGQPTYDPTRLFNQQDVFTFLESMLYREPGSVPPVYRVQPFFIWYAPRIPHTPLTAPLPITEYLFGPNPTGPGLGGVMNLGRFCGPNGCAPTVGAFAEGSLGFQTDFYGNMWWIDDSVREIREWLARASQPHCIGADGRGLYETATPAECLGLWASQITPDLPSNTIIVYLSDNGWFLPDAKHHYTENGYRTRIVVFDPRQLAAVPPAEPIGQTPPPPRETEALAHAVDVLPTILGLALDTPGTQSCPTGSDGKPCDGRDLRPHLLDQAGLPAAAPATLRRALCGHQTEKGVAPTNNRYLLTRPGTVGRCTDLDAPACSADADCGVDAVCLGGHCLGTTEPACTQSAECPTGGVCLDGLCRMGPACIDDATCAQAFPGRNTACVEPQTRWCRNAIGTRCSTHADCPACPPGPGPGGAAPPCARICEARSLKLYVTPVGVPGALPRADVTDLFLDPDEVGRERGYSGTLTFEMSRPGGPYTSTAATLSCCLDDWWPEVAATAGTLCTGTCPAQFTCNQ